MPEISILIVEDEVIVAADLAMKLERLGHKVAGMTAQGEEALKLVRELRPTLVLMDIGLAGAVDGVEAATRIRREFDVGVLFLTASSDRATLSRANGAGALGFILKPFEDGELESQLVMALRKQQAAGPA
jgi:CheY-like chemotaxis protein